MENIPAEHSQYYVHIDKVFTFPGCYTTYKDIKLQLEQGIKVILDFSECTHIDSSALGGLFSLRKNFRQDAELKIINANSHIMSIFKIYKLGKALDIEGK